MCWNTMITKTFSWVSGALIRAEKCISNWAVLKQYSVLPARWAEAAGYKKKRDTEHHLNEVEPEKPSQTIFFC